MLKTIFIFLGPPGSGKGSLSQLCAKRLGWVQLSTGNLCRQNICEQTEIGKQIDFAIKSGKLITDSLIISMVDEWLRANSELHKAVILDGFPRTVAQAESLSEFLALPHLSQVKLKVVKMVLEDASVMKRLSMRSICKNSKCQAVYSLANGSPLKPRKHALCDECASPLMQRSDDDEETTRQRLLMYHKHEQGLSDFYQKQRQNIIALNVEQPLEKVYDQLLGIVGCEII